MDFVINHKRFKKRYKNEHPENLKTHRTAIKQFPQRSDNYFNFFSTFAPKNYQLINNPCLCGSEHDVFLSQTDRHGINFDTVVCLDCGLIRAKDYFREEDVTDFYSNHYRKIDYSAAENVLTPENFFEQQSLESKYKYELIKKLSPDGLQNKKIVDVGGGIGGVLSHFDTSNELFVFDFFDPFLEYANTRGITAVKGGLESINFKPDVIILSHVIEHWNNFEREIKKLIDIQEIGKTLNYIEFPGVDSVKFGRRGGDILGDIHVPHVYYFTSYVFENLMNRFGFEKIYLDSLIKSIFVYTGNRHSLVNHYNKVQKDLRLGERRRVLQIWTNIVRSLIPNFIWIRLQKLVHIPSELQT